jgi:hypothetical protein
MVPLAAVTALAILVMWFPLATLWSQQRQLDATSAQIAAISQQEQALRARASAVSSPVTAVRLARQDYQLVEPGQSLIQVLPGAGSGANPGYGGDPGLQPLVAPPSLNAAPPTAQSSSSGWSRFVGRLIRTLEFWR